jgi:hypothetical protein
MHWQSAQSSDEGQHVNILGLLAESIIPNHSSANFMILCPITMVQSRCPHESRCQHTIFAPQNESTWVYPCKWENRWMGFNVIGSRTIFSWPYEHRRVITGCDKPISIVTEHHHIYDRGVHKFAIVFLVLKLRHDKPWRPLEGTCSRVRTSMCRTKGNVRSTLKCYQQMWQHVLPNWRLPSGCLHCFTPQLGIRHLS